MGRSKSGVRVDTASAIRDPIGHIAADPGLPRTATKLAELAGVARATLHRTFTAHPERRDSFPRLTDQIPAKQRARLENDIADRPQRRVITRTCGSTT